MTRGNAVTCCGLGIWKSKGLRGLDKDVCVCVCGVCLLGDAEGEIECLKICVFECVVVVFVCRVWVCVYVVFCVCACVACVSHLCVFLCGCVCSVCGCEVGVCVSVAIPLYCWLLLTPTSCPYGWQISIVKITCKFQPTWMSVCMCVIDTQRLHLAP
jgi:hypothetical protein